MALIQCDECGRGITDKASACPGCGAPVTVPVNLLMPLPSPQATPPGSVGSPSEPNAQTARQRRRERRHRRERERMARINEILRSREPAPHLARLVEADMHAWLVELMKYKSDDERLRKLHAQRNVSLLYRLGARPNRRQRIDIRAMPLEELREWNGALETQYALTLDYAMRMSDWEHFVIGLRHFLRANIVIQSICIPILAMVGVSYELAPGLYQLLQYPGMLVGVLEIGTLVQLLTINDWNRTGKAGARVELDKKQETARIELAPALESPLYIRGDI